MALGLVVPSPAVAHVTLLASTPEQGEVLEALPEQVTLEFTEDLVEPAYVLVRSPEGALVSVGDPEVGGAGVTQALAGDGLRGTYSIAYRVVSKDGHPLTGEVSFSIGEPGETQAGPAESGESGESGGGAPLESTVEAGAPAPTDSGDVARRGLDVGVPVVLFLLALMLYGWSRRVTT